MKNAITLLLLHCCLSATAQYRGAENNYYTLSEKDSVSTTTNYVSAVLNNGATLYWPYGGALQILGNNYVHKFRSPLNGDILHPGFCRLGNSSVWVTQANKAYLLSADKIIDSFTSKGEIYLMNVTNSSLPILWFTYKKDNLFHVARYDNGHVKEYSEPPFKLDIYHTLWINEKGNILVGKPNEFCELSENGFGPVHQYFLPSKTFYILSANKPSSSFIAKTIESNPTLLNIQKDLIRPIQTSSAIKDISLLYDDVAVINYTNNNKEILRFTDSNPVVVSRFHNVDMYTNVVKASEGSFYLGGHNKLIRTFTYIKKYPNLFEGSNSSSIFSIQQADDGSIWASSYRGYLSRINENGLQSINTNNIFISNGGCSIGDKVYMVGEGHNNGLLQFNKNGMFRKITQNVTGFYNYVDNSMGTLYFGTAGKGLWSTSINKLNDKVIQWDTVSQKQGLSLPNIVTITKDKIGRLWLGQPSRGWAVYNPKQKKAVTRLIEKNETDFGLMSSFTDNQGTVWLGSKQRGLLYYNNYHNDTIAISDILQIIHPLLVNGKTITTITQWGNWLIIGATDYYLAFDLEAWYNTKKVLIRYINPQEAAFTGTTEQNTVLIDKRDSSVWFSTTDMLYQWDFKQWLTLPTYKVVPEVAMNLNGNSIGLHENKSFHLKPVENNLSFSVWFQSPDNMPRYLSVSLSKKGDSLQFSPPSLQTHFNYTNLAPGKYILAVQICQSDGSVTIHQFPITIKNFWWQLWWVWVLAFIVLSSVLLYILNIRKKKKVAEEVAKTKAAELETVKAKQQKELANLQVVALSSQFRPHFILNALNTIGAQMDDKPEAESVLSRLGESINIIFNHAQQQNIAHSLADEWKLVTNIIHIHQLMYLKKLEFVLPTAEQIQLLADIQLPLGLLQIPVENALLHGLSNKETGPWFLHIVLKVEKESINIAISDNGVGRTNAATLSNFRKHGTGSKNIAGILAIINEGKEQKIDVGFADNFFIGDDSHTGTTVIISIPKQFSYER